MYFPYFRGKQYELITIRETASLFFESGFIPIIEPVKESLNGLQKALDEVINAKGEAIVLVNPFHGDHSGNGQNISGLLKQSFDNNPNISAGILLDEKMSVLDVMNCCEIHASHSLALIHNGFTSAKELNEALEGKTQ